MTGYQTQDLVLKPAFVAACRWPRSQALAARLRRWPGAGHRRRRCADGGRLYNAYYVLAGRPGRGDGAEAPPAQRRRLRRKARLRLGRCRRALTAIGPLRIGTPICEDAWHPDVCETLAETGAEILLVPNGSPYHRGKPDVRMNLMVARVVETGLPLVYLNMVGGQDDQVFDGASFVLNPGGRAGGAAAAVRRVRRACRFRRRRPRAGAPSPGAMAPHPDDRRGRLPRHGDGPARLPGARSGFAQGAAGPVGRHRQRHRRHHRRRCASGRRTCAA